MIAYDVIIIGAGAAGLMCAFTAGERGLRVLLLEHTDKPGAKILISGGGRCNFTNLDVQAGCFLGENPHFAKSALSRFTPWDIMDFLAAGGASWHEKTLGQLFCDQGAGKILSILLDACNAAAVDLRVQASVDAVHCEDGGYNVETSEGPFKAPALVCATGGISIPKMGATDFAYKLAHQFGLAVVEPRPALVPLTFDSETVAAMKNLAGIAADCIATAGGVPFRENLLFTHRGLSGPAILQVSSYWQPGAPISLNLLPQIPDVFNWLKDQKKARPKAKLHSILSEHLSGRLAEWIAAEVDGNMADLPEKHLKQIAEGLTDWTLVPTGTEGFKKAEVTRGGISTAAISSKTMEVSTQPGLYFIGECVDVTGWLGGYNFQWAWASGVAAGKAV